MLNLVFRPLILHNFLNPARSITKRNKDVFSFSLVCKICFKNNILNDIRTFEFEQNLYFSFDDLLIFNVLEGNSFDS